MNRLCEDKNVLKKGILKGAKSHFCRFCKRDKSGFTLAEMMVVMLILSIILAAMAPVMTTRNKTDYSSPWRYAANGSDAYFAGNSNSNQVAMIGQNVVDDGENNARLILRTASGSGWSHLMFKTGNTIVGRLYLDESNLFLSNNNNPSGSNNTSVGVGTLANANDSSSGNTAIGRSAMNALTSGKYNVGIGSSALIKETTSEGNTAIGFESMRDKGTGNYNTAIGYRANYDSSGTHNMTGSVAIGAASGSFAEDAIAIGYLSDARAMRSMALGPETVAGNEYSMAIGDEAEVYGDYALALGTYLPRAYGNSSIAIGKEAHAGASGSGGSTVGGQSSIAIGRYATAVPDYSISIGESANNTISSNSNEKMIAIGYNPQASGDSSIAIGDEASATNIASIAIGSNVKAQNNYSIAIGGSSTYQTVSSGYNSIAIGGSSTYQTVSSGYDSIAIGEGAVASGDLSVALGRKSIARGTKNIAIGDNACASVTGSNKVCIGANSGPTSGSEATNSEEMIYIGSKPKWGPIRGSGWADDAVLVVHNSTKTIGVGSRRGGMEAGPTVYINGNLVVRGYTYTVGRGDDNHETEPIGVLGNKNGSLDGDQVKWYSISEPGDYWTSDRRLKYVGKENKAGLDKIRQLKVFNYTFKKDQKKTPHVGVIAQDLQKVFPNAVQKGVDGFLKIRMEDMFYAVINAIKELDSRVTKLEKENQELEARIERLEAKVK